MKNATGDGKRQLEKLDFPFLSQFAFGLRQGSKRLSNTFLERSDLRARFLSSLSQAVGERFLPDLRQLCLKALFARF
jgi:hypothetical protein